ncbi:MAG TPA: chorismate synthase [Candidatus Nanoarchaeia archaeon]|nr:chorismate synthase [Candidatus Nanoarchaeia archaeon]
MAGNSIGKAFVVTSFGESHGKQVGVVVDGCPAGLKFSEADVQADLDLRVPTQKPQIVSARREKDVVQISSGVFNGFTTGAPICMTVENKENRSSDYESIRDLPRPSHADYTASVKYGGFSDYRGGGRFSGRVTVANIMAGSLAQKLLKNFGVEVAAYSESVGKIKMEKELGFEEILELRYKSAIRCPDLEKAEKMEEAVADAAKSGDSLGGIIECIAINVPAGVGEPLMDALDADLAKAIFAIPAVKGVEFGAGFALTQMTGSEANDAFRMREGKVTVCSNLAGGILGGISTGAPITIRVAIKPTPSIAKEQRTVDLSKMRDASIKIGGRHDPCVMPKAVPAVEAAVAITLADHMIRACIIPRVLKEQ